MMKEQINTSTSQVFSANEESPLNILYNDFAENPERNNQKVTAMAKELRKMLHHKSAECADDIMDRISLLCAEYQREGFFAGVRIGMKLINEISR